VVKRDQTRGNGHHTRRRIRYLHGCGRYGDDASSKHALPAGMQRGLDEGIFSFSGAERGIPNHLPRHCQCFPTPEWLSTLKGLHRYVSGRLFQKLRRNQIRAFLQGFVMECAAKACGTASARSDQKDHCTPYAELDTAASMIKSLTQRNVCGD